MRNENKRECEQSQMEKSIGSCDDSLKVELLECVRCDGIVKDLSNACLNRKTIKSCQF